MDLGIIWGFDATIFVLIFLAIAVVVDCIFMLLWLKERKMNRRGFSRGVLNIDKMNLYKLVTSANRTIQTGEDFKIRLKNKSGRDTDWELDLYENIFK